MELNDIINLLIGGGLATIITLPFIRRKAKGEADKADIDNLRDIIEELKKYYNERIQCLEERIQTLEGKKCEVLDCPHRIPPSVSKNEE